VFWKKYSASFVSTEFVHPRRNGVQITTWLPSVLEAIVDPLAVILRIFCPVVELVCVDKGTNDEEFRARLGPSMANKCLERRQRHERPCRIGFRSLRRKDFAQSERRLDDASQVKFGRILDRQRELVELSSMCATDANGHENEVSESNRIEVK